MAAFLAAGDPSAFPHGGAPWQPLKLYYNQTFSRRRIVMFHEALLARGMDSPYAEWLTGWAERTERTVTTEVYCADHFEARDAALKAHATQVDPDGRFFSVPMDLQRQIWPHEDYELALSHVPVRLPETELFSGLGALDRADDLATTWPLPVMYDGRVNLIDKEVAV
jgi:mycothiol S-conjugate amidase